MAIFVLIVLIILFICTVNKSFVKLEKAATVMKYKWIVFLALVARAMTVVIMVFTKSHDKIFYSYVGILNVICLVLLVVWAVMNYRQKWIVLFGIGAFLNLLAVAFNGGRMPVEIGTLRIIGNSDLIHSLLSGKGLYHITLLDDSKLQCLADIYSVHFAGVTRVFSIGDVLLYLGLFLHILSYILVGSERYEK